MSNQPRPETDDQTPGDQMNAVPHITDPAAQRLADANLYYTDADGLDALTEIAEVADEEARLFSAEALRLREAMDALDKLMGSQVGTRKSRAERVLFQPGGDLDVQRARRYLQLTVGGLTAREALSQMVADHAAARVQHGRDVSKRLRSRGDKAAAGAPTSDGAVERSLEMRHVGPNVPPSGVAPALPPAPTALPKREPGASMKAPPEALVEQTGQLARRAIDELLKAGEDTSVSEAALASSYPTAAPSFGPAADPKFAPSALPQVRAGDTQRIPAVEAAAEGAEPKLPFSGAASTAAAPKTGSAVGGRKAVAEAKGGADDDA